MKVLEFNTQELEGSKKMVLDLSFNLDSYAGCIFTFKQIWKIEKSRFIESQYCPIKIQKNI